jgi:hypothetical protein
MSRRKKIIVKDEKNCDTFDILITNKLLNSHYKCFGHFVIDHLFMLFKFKYYLKSKNINVENLNINCNKKFIKPFMIQFYSLIFNKIIYNSSSEKSINLGVVLGSLENTETEKIYLSKSISKNNIIPNTLYENSRKLSNENSYYMIKFREYIWEKLKIKRNEIIDLLIINRKSNGRTWMNLDNLKIKLRDKNFKIVYMEELTIQEQINMIYNSKNILLPSGSSQSHIFWTDPSFSTCIECFIPGHRYINTLLYAKNLKLRLVTMFCDYDFRKIRLNNNLKKIYEYQQTSKKVLDSENITEKEIQEEIKWFNIFLTGECAEFYGRMVYENIDIDKYSDKIIDFVK